MIATVPELLEALHARGSVPNPAPVFPAQDAQDRPWFVSLLLGAAGWVAGILVLIFVALTFARGSSAGGSVLAVGIVLLAMAYGLFWAAGRAGFAAFASQAALSVSVAGQFAKLFGVAELIDRNFSIKEVPTLAGIALVMQVVLAALMPNRLHRSMSTLFACIAWAVMLHYSLPQAMAHMTWIVTWLPLAGALFVIARNEPAWIARGHAAIVRPVAAGLVVALALGTLASEPWAWVIGPHGTSGSFAAWPVLSALAALAALAAAFALGSMGLAAVCIAAAIGHIFHLYYSLEATLLVKAATLAVIGTACLALAWSTRARAAP